MQYDRELLAKATAIQSDLARIHEASNSKQEELDAILDELRQGHHCELCGHQKLLFVYSWVSPKGWYIQCPNCSARTPKCASLTQAQRFWESMLSVKAEIVVEEET